MIALIKCQRQIWVHHYLNVVYAYKQVYMYACMDTYIHSAMILCTVHNVYFKHQVVLA